MPFIFDALLFFFSITIIVSVHLFFPEKSLFQPKYLFTKGVTFAISPTLSPWAVAKLFESIAGLQVCVPSSCSTALESRLSSAFSFSFLNSSIHFSVLLVSGLTRSPRMPIVLACTYPWNFSLASSVLLHSSVFWLVYILYLWTKRTNKETNRYYSDVSTYVHFSSFAWYMAYSSTWLLALCGFESLKCGKSVLRCSLSVKCTLGLSNM